MTIGMPRIDRLPAQERGVTIGDFLVPIRLGERISPLLRHVVLVVLGALLIALFEVGVSAYASYTAATVALYGALLAILFLRPQGLFGEAARRRA
jgi:hypothetical protein